MTFFLVISLFRNFTPMVIAYDSAEEACMAAAQKKNPNVFKAKMEKGTGRILWTKPVACVVAVEAK